MFEMIKQSPDYFQINTKTGKSVGEIYKECDGLYVFSFTDTPRGCFAGHFFNFVGTRLKELNAEFLAETEEYFEEQMRKQLAKSFHNPFWPVYK